MGRRKPGLGREPGRLHRHCRAQSTVVRLQTTMGPIDMSLLAAEVPLTVANFLAYVRSPNYLEAAYPQYQYLAPSQGSPGEALGYVYRYYSGSNAYVGTKDGKVWYLVPAISSNVSELGTIANWLVTAAAAGY